MSAFDTFFAGSNLTIPTGATQSTLIGIGGNLGVGASGQTVAGYFASGMPLATGATALGYQSRASIPYTANIRGAQIISNSENGSAADAFWRYAGAEIFLFTEPFSCLATGQVQITLPPGCHFYTNECGLVVTSGLVVSGAPTVTFGIFGSESKFQGSTVTTGLLNQFSRQRFTTLSSTSGETNLVARITATGSGVALIAKAYFKGALLED